MLLALPLSAQDTPAPEAGEEEEEAQESPFADFEKLVEEAEHIPGFFDVYVADGKVYLAVPRDRLGEDFLVDYRVAQGIGASGLYGGTTLTYFEMDLMALEEHGEKIYLVKRPHRFGAESDPRAQAAVAITFGSSVVESASVEATRPDSAVVIDATGWFVSDLSGVSRTAGRSASTQPGRPGNVNFDRDRSYLGEVKGFPESITVEAKLTFRASEPVKLPSVPDGRFIPVTIQYTLAKLPEEPMERRLGDDRVGNFWTRTQGLQRRRVDVLPALREPVAPRARRARR